MRFSSARVVPSGLRNCVVPQAMGSRPRLQHVAALRLIVSNCRHTAPAAAPVKHLQNHRGWRRLGFRPFGSNCRNASHRVDRQRPHL